MIEVYIADDHPAIIWGITQVLQETDDIRITGAYHSGKTLMEALQEKTPDILLLDVHMPDIMGNLICRMVSEKYPEIGVLAFTNMLTDFHIKDMLSHGCKGYILKTANRNTLINSIREVYNGNTFLDGELKAEVKNDITEQNKKVKYMPHLTKREQEVLQFICSGYNNRQIADSLGISLRTVEGHRFNLLQKLNVSNVVELVKLALSSGMATDGW